VPQGGLAPDAVVLVATVRAMKMNGGVAKADLGAENVEAVQKGCANLGRHIRNVKSFGVPVVVGINHFAGDTEAEIEAVKAYVAEQGSEAILCKHWAEGGAGIEEMARRVAELAESGQAQFAPLYPDEMPLFEKIERIAKSIYHAERGDRRQEGARPAARMGGAGLRQPAGLHGQDAVFLLDRSEPARRARGAYAADPRGAPVGGCRVRRGDLRRDHDDAGPAARSGLRDDPLNDGGLIEGLF
jgi:hypothetical protein